MMRDAVHPAVTARLRQRAGEERAAPGAVQHARLRYGREWLQASGEGAYTAATQQTYAPQRFALI